MPITLLLASGAACQSQKPDMPVPKEEDRATTARHWLPAFLTAGDAAVAFTDTHYTVSHKSFVENDPLARPFIRPSAVAYGTDVVETVGLSYVASRMRRSPRWHLLWWLPQAMAITGHGIALQQSIKGFRRP